MHDLTIYDEDTDTDIRLPFTYVVCDTCRGHGTQDAWDGGMTASEMDEQGSDFLDDYLDGVYDVPCRECNGERVTRVPDRNRCTAEQLAIFDQQERERAEMQADQEMERRAGC